MTDNYPEVAQATTLAQQSYDLALEVRVDSPEMYEVAGDELRGIVTRRKKIEELRLSLTRPIDQAKANIMNLFRGPTDRLAQAESLLRDEMTRYQREEREKAEAARREAEARAAAERAEQERIQREAEAARRKAEAEAEAARKAGDDAAAKAAAEAAAAQRQAAEAAREKVELADVAPPMPIATITPKAQGVSTRKNWKAEVTDFKALVIAAAERAKGGDDFLLGFLLPNDKALGTAAKSMQAKLVVPGVRAYFEDVLSARRKAG
jgi:membrane protein involved in colicin uptake